MAQPLTVHETVVEMLIEAIRVSPQRIAVIQGERVLDYAAYGDCVAAFAGELSREGAQGERVALICKNSIEVAISYFAGHAAGAQIVPLNPSYTVRELREILDDATPSIVIYDGELKETLAPLLIAAYIKRAIAIGDGGRDLAQPEPDTAAWNTLPPPALEHLATLQYTGGTTGRPKGVNLNHYQIAINLVQRQSLVPLEIGAERILCFMPMFHSFAMHLCVQASVHTHNTMIILERYHPAEVLQAIERHGITCLPAGPTVFAGLLNFPGFAEADFSALKLAISGSAPLPARTLGEWEERTGCIVCEGYGQTEAGPVLTFNPRYGLRKAGTAGPAVPHTEIQIVDTATGTTRMEIGELGEIRARGPQIMSGYRRRPDENSQALRRGWLYTGDIGFLDRDGYLTVCDRKKDMVIVSGYNVFPREVDDVLVTHPAVAEAATVGVPDDYRGEVLHAFIVPRTASVVDDEDLLDYCRRNLAPYKIPAAVHIVAELPRTKVGKVDRGALRKISMPAAKPDLPRPSPK